ncbi:ABC transporter ATP-binding protein [Weissella confusa]|uniref:ABC transporter ATP-binding protein n=1 Tax=Weissella fermenti TaxID=2987699 RepID=A0ABT6D1H9_9LACO|nr:MULTISPECIES: ABC transporter ATP-binding protein [Weissella]MBJ7687980.1 ABC transporter ATP-binding protein [Weissella confusa]MCW0926905.1 ABC transporter ATP-binding protein [Weissella sp. LMG 11983]MDF9299338.1 ABC transporter ATP-binding protein [Weissella sp. BK2]
MLKLNHVSFNRNNKHILNDVSASLAANRITTLIGPNGAGKTTLLQLITDDLKPSAGSITERPKKIALLAQKNELFEPLTVRDLLTIKQPSLDEHIIKDLKLEELLDQNMLTLSGGQQQLAWLAFVLHQAPDLLILDEPTTYLDLQYQQIFLKTLQRVQKERHLTVIMVLHDLNQAFAYSDNIWLLNKSGELATAETPTLLDAEKLSVAFQTPLKIVSVDEQTLILPS